MTEAQIHEALMAGRSVRDIASEAGIGHMRVWRIKSKLQAVGLATVVDAAAQMRTPEAGQGEVSTIAQGLPTIRLQTAQELYEEITEVKDGILDEIRLSMDAHDQRGIVAMVGCYTQTCKLMLDIASTQQAIESQRDTGIPESIRELIDELAL